MLRLDSGEKQRVRLRLASGKIASGESMGGSFDTMMSKRINESDEFYAAVLPKHLKTEARNVARQAYAGLLWTKQFYQYIIKKWLDGDLNMPVPPKNRRQGRNTEWTHLHNRDILSVPDKWEYPWFAAWDLVLFHEYFDGDTGKGLGASHQTGWTALVVRCIESVRNPSNKRHNL